jgi:hypothetical protein
MEQNKNFERESAAHSAPRQLPAPLEALPPSPLPDFDPVPLRHRHDGWTPERQRAFIEALADTLCVKTAAERVGMSEASAFRLRRRAGARGFGAAWAAAYRQGITERVAPIALDRALNGTVVRRFYHGELIAEERVYSDRLLLALLAKADRFFPATGEAEAFLGDWEGSMERLESGALEPDGRVWRDRNGNWTTDYPPPDDFDGWQEGEPGEDGYERTLTAIELEAVRTQRAGRLAQATVARDLYFGVQPKARARQGAAPGQAGRRR